MNKYLKTILKVIFLLTASGLLFTISNQIGAISIVIFIIYLSLFFSSKQIMVISLLLLVTSFILYISGQTEAYEIFGNFVYGGLISLFVSELVGLIKMR